MTTIEEETIINLFPALSCDKGYKVTSQNTRDYNCIAWAIGRNDIWYWPYLGNEHKIDEYWPNGIPDTDEIHSFVLAMESEGFVKCDDGELESGYIKIALFQQSGKCTHATRQLQSGLWTSKMGPLHDIRHSTPQTLEGNFYGTVFCYMKKKI